MSEQYFTVHHGDTLNIECKLKRKFENYIYDETVEDKESTDLVKRVKNVSKEFHNFVEIQIKKFEITKTIRHNLLHEDDKKLWKPEWLMETTTCYQKSRYNP